MPQHERELMTVKEAAEWLGISPGTLAHWISERRIPVTRFSARCVKLRRSILERWLDDLTQPADKLIP